MKIPTNTCLKINSFSDLGAGQKNWLQFIQEQMRHDDQQKCYTKSSIQTKTCKGSAKDNSISQKLEEEMDTKGDLDALELKQLQQEGNSVDAASLHDTVETQYKSRKDELDEDGSHSSSHSPERTRTQLPIGGAPITPLSALLNTSLSSPTLLLPHGEYLQNHCLYLY